MEKQIIDLSLLKILSIEIGADCNLKLLHKECPINHIERKNVEQYMTIEQICKIIDDANKLNFKGYVAFHYYNEPLMFMDRIVDVIKRRPSQRYLLWSNGLLIEQIEANGYDLNLFEKIVLTCYDEKYLPMFSRVKEIHGNVEIGMADMDDRLSGYKSDYENLISCKKIYFELPINCYGEVTLCTHDWKNSYKIGNIKENSFYQIITSDIYQNLLRMSKKIAINSKAPDICKHCRYAHLTYHKGEELLKR